ncbi:MAG: prepilin-type N-terminal cleavage/methylation domain-containing protein [Candidatus Omnitrophota bacterium]
MLLLRRKRAYNKRAFSLIELVITCLVITILVGLAVPSYMTHRLRAEEQKAVATLYAFAQAQKAFWFEQNPNTYCNIFSDLSPSYVDLADDDGDWQYSITGDASSFTVLAQHLNLFGAIDGLSLEINEQGVIDRQGPWPYTVYETP